MLAVVAVVAGFLILRNITDDNDGATRAIGDGSGEVVDSTTTTVDLGLADDHLRADDDRPGRSSPRVRPSSWPMRAVCLVRPDA